MTGDTIIVQTADETTVQVKKNPSKSVVSAFVMIKGVVLSEGSVQELEMTAFGDNFGKNCQIIFDSLTISASTVGVTGNNTMLVVYVIVLTPLSFETTMAYRQTWRTTRR